MSLIHDYQASFRERSAYLSEEMTSQPVEWADAPFKHTFRPGALEIPLPNGKRLVARLAEAGNPGSVSVLSLAQMLWYANGLIRRKFDVDWTNPAPASSRPHSGTYARGTASGGALYPVELYLATGDLDGLPDGIYHHCEARSSLQRVRAGRFSAALAGSWSGEARAGVSHIVLAVRFWKNVFKYKNFGYQVMTEDCGAMLGTLLQVAQDLEIPSKVRFCFEDRAIGDLIGLDFREEVVMAVLELGKGADRVTVQTESSPRLRQLSIAHFERSKRVTIPDLIHDVHATTLISKVRPLPVISVWQSSEGRDADLRLPAPATIRSSAELFINRRSSMGRQCTTSPITQQELSTLLAAAQQPYDSDLAPLPSPPRSVRLAVFARNVNGLPAGNYAYHDADHALERLAHHDRQIKDIQKLYYLQNYNLDQTGLLVGVVARHREAHAAWGDRSIRMCNGEAGLVAQRLYMAASYLNLSCGAVLGFNSAESDAMFSLSRPDESVVLMLLVARHPPQRAMFDAQFHG